MKWISENLSISVPALLLHGFQWLAVLLWPVLVSGRGSVEDRKVIIHLTQWNWILFYKIFLTIHSNTTVDFILEAMDFVCAIQKQTNKLLCALPANSSCLELKDVRHLLILPFCAICCLPSKTDGYPINRPLMPPQASPGTPTSPPSPKLSGITLRPTRIKERRGKTWS